LFNLSPGPIGEKKDWDFFSFLFAHKALSPFNNDVFYCQEQKFLFVRGEDMFFYNLFRPFLLLDSLFRKIALLTLIKIMY